jgi:hypothetical protein
MTDFDLFLNTSGWQVDLKKREWLFRKSALGDQCGLGPSRFELQISVWVIEKEREMGSSGQRSWWRRHACSAVRTSLGNLQNSVSVLQNTAVEAQACKSCQGGHTYCA